MWGFRAAIAGFVLILAGCSSTAQPETLEPLPNPNTAFSPSSVETPRASSATATSDAGGSGAIQALDGYFDAANRASAGQDIRGFRELFADSCGLCSTQHRNFSQAYAQGRTALGTLYESWTIDVVDATGSQVVLHSVADTGTITLVDADGVVIEAYPSESQVNTVWTLVKDSGDKWLVVDARDVA